MSVELILYAGSLFIIVWGITHIVPSKSTLKVINEISGDNNKIASLEWVLEGVGLILIGLLVTIVTYIAGAEKVGSGIVYLASGTLLLILVLWSLSRMSDKWTRAMKAGPVLMSIVAIIYILSILI